MGTETRTEFEVVEHDVDVDYCDGCGREDCTLIELPIGLEGEVTVSHELQEVEKPNRSAIMDFGAPSKNNAIPLDEARSLASRDREYQLETTKTAELCKADEVIDACPNCLREAFGAEVPEDYERLDIGRNLWEFKTDDDYDWERLGELMIERREASERRVIPTGSFDALIRMVDAVFEFIADTVRHLVDRIGVGGVLILYMVFALLLILLAP